MRSEVFLEGRRRRAGLPVVRKGATLDDVDLVGQALPVGAVVSLALAPFWALALVWGSPQPTRVRFQIWLGLCVAFVMAWAVPMHGLMRAIDGIGVEIWLAPVVCIASGVLGVRAIAV